MSQLNDAEDNLPTFSKLGQLYQVKLLNEILTPNNINLKTNNLFFDEIILNIDSNYFEDKSLRMIMIQIKNYYDKYQLPPNIENIFSIVNTEVQNDVDRAEIVARLQQIRKISIDRKNGSINNDTQLIKDQSLNFIKQKELLKALIHGETLLNNGNVGDYLLDDVIDKIKKVSNIGKVKQNIIDIFDNEDEVFSASTRQYVKTGVKFIDDAFGTFHGIAKGEILVFLAGQGNGKSSFLSLVAANQYKSGENVLMIVLEGQLNDIRAKVYSSLVGIPTSELVKQKEKAKERLKVVKQNPNLGNLTITRMPDGTKISEIKKLIEDTEIKTGKKLTSLVLDYYDCVSSDGNFGANDEFRNQSLVVKALDNMADFYQIAIFTACQAGKNANIAPILTLADIYGSAMLGKKAAVVIGCAATPEMKKNNLNNFMISKCRFTGNGMMWENVRFDKDNLTIEVDDPNSVFNETLVKEAEKFENKYDEVELLKPAHPLQGINLN
jgi:hypothetical protein